MPLVLQMIVICHLWHPLLQLSLEAVIVGRKCWMLLFAFWITRRDFVKHNAKIYTSMAFYSFGRKRHTRVWLRFTFNYWHFAPIICKYAKCRQDRENMIMNPLNFKCWITSYPRILRDIRVEKVLLQL